MRKIEINYTNEYGEKFGVTREIDDDFNYSEVEFLHESYKAFLNNFGYPVNSDEEIVVLGADEYIENCYDGDNCDDDEYCEDDFCDGDCENCDIDEESLSDDERFWIDENEFISEALKNHAKEIADIVATEFNKAKSNIGWKDYIKSV